MMTGASGNEDGYGSVFNQGHTNDQSQLLRGGLGPNALDLFSQQSQQGQQQGQRVQQQQQQQQQQQGLQQPGASMTSPALVYASGLPAAPSSMSSRAPGPRALGVDSSSGRGLGLPSATTASDRKAQGNFAGSAGGGSGEQKQVCTFFMRTGTCAYGERCKFSHPQDRPPPQLNSRGYPLRPEEIDCAHYMKKGWCAFGLTCKFNHPELAPVVSPFSLTPGQSSFVGLPTAQAYAPAAGVYAMPSAVQAMPTVYYVPAQLPPSQPATLLNPTNSLSAFQAAVPSQATAGPYASLTQTMASTGLYRQAPGYGNNMLPMQHVLSDQHALMMGQHQPRADQLQQAMNHLRLRDK